MSIATMSLSSKMSLPLHLLAPVSSGAAIEIGLPIDTAAHGACLITAAHLAIAQHHQRGGIPVRAVWCDDQRSAEGGHTAARHLADRGIRYVIGHFSSRAAMTAAQIYRDAGMLFVAPGASAPELTASPGASTVLRLFGRDDTQADAIVHRLRQLQPTGDVEVYLEDNRYGHSLGTHLKNALARANIAARLVVTRDGDDIVSVGAGPVVVAGTREFSAQVLRRLDRSRTRIASDDACHVAFLDEAGEAADGVLIPIFAVPAQREAAACLNAACHDLIGRPPGAYFLTSFTAVDLLLRVLHHLGDCGGVQAAAFLREQSWTTVLGDLSFAPSGEVTGLEWRLARIAQRQFIVT